MHKTKRKKYLIFVSTLTSLVIGGIGALMIITQLNLNLKFKSSEASVVLEKNEPLQISSQSNTNQVLNSTTVNFGKDLKSIYLPEIKNEIYFLLEDQDGAEIVSIDKDFKVSRLYNLDMSVTEIHLYPNFVLSYVQEDETFGDQSLVIVDDNDELFSHKFDESEKLLSYKFDLNEKIFYLLLLNRNNEYLIKTLDLQGNVNEIFTTTSFEVTEIINIKNDSVYLFTKSKCYSLNLVSKKVLNEKCQNLKFSDSNQNIIKLTNKIEVVQIDSLKQSQLDLTFENNPSLQQNDLIYPKAGNLWTYNLAEKEEKLFGMYSSTLRINKALAFNGHLLVIAEDLFGTKILKSLEKIEDIDPESEEVIQWESITLTQQEYDEIKVLNSEAKVL